jgi:bifunctional non-homologous end joining protein LigD
MATRARKLKEPNVYLTNGKTLPAVPGAKHEKMPDVILPMLATLIKEPFSDPEWLYEFKLDGVRAICFIHNGKMRLVSRNKKDITSRYPELRELAESVDADQAILDGEVVVLDDKGLPNFQMLQSRIGLTREQEIDRLAAQNPVIYNVFDLLYYNGFNLMPAMLIHRKTLLREIITEEPFLRYCEHVAGEGEKLFSKARKQGLEGVVAKLESSSYTQKRSNDWLKIKAIRQQEVVITGYTKPKGSRILFGSLLVGIYEKGELIYADNVGGGFNEANLKKVHSMMQPLKSKDSPFQRPPKTGEPVQWIRAALVCEVKFSEWTTDGKLRQPVFLGIRDDKDPVECVREA